MKKTDACSEGKIEEREEEENLPWVILVVVCL